MKLCKCMSIWDILRNILLVSSKVRIFSFVDKLIWPFFILYVWLSGMVPGINLPGSFRSLGIMHLIKWGWVLQRFFINLFRDSYKIIECKENMHMKRGRWGKVHTWKGDTRVTHGTFMQRGLLHWTEPFTHREIPVFYFICAYLNMSIIKTWLYPNNYVSMFEGKTISWPRMTVLLFNNSCPRYPLCRNVSEMVHTWS
jgi:hypothetical protein